MLICLVLMLDTFQQFRNTYAAAAKSLQSCPTLCNPVDGSPPGSPVPGILQARVLEWGAIAFSKEYIYILTCIYMFIYVCIHENISLCS